MKIPLVIIFLIPLVLLGIFVLNEGSSAVEESKVYIKLVLES